jgi:hypothetical protein
MRILTTPRLALLSVIFLACLSTASAGEFSTVINGKSYHLNASEDWNGDNYGLGLEYEFATETRWKKRLMANGFRDSNDQMSYMAGGGLHRNLYSGDHLKGLYVDAGINAFLMTRKDINDNRPFPAALPSVTVGNRYVGLNLTYLPRKAVEQLYDSEMMDQSISGIVFLQFKMNVGQMLGSD